MADKYDKIDYGKTDGALKDNETRTFVLSYFSLFITALFAAYNIFLGVTYGAQWNVCIAVYYTLLVILRAYVLLFEKKKNKNAKERNINFLIQSVLLFALDVALIAPITLMVLQKKVVHYTSIPAITAAAYTTCKIIISTVNFVKNRKRLNLSVIMLKDISFIDALVSVLVLQYILIMTFGSGVEGKMFVLCAATSFAIWALIIFVSIFSIVKAIRLIRVKSHTG